MQLNPTTLGQLETEWESMNVKGAMTAIGLEKANLGKLVDVVESHELGATARAVLIYVRGMLQRTSQQFNDVVDDPATISEWKKGVPSSSSVDRSIPLAAVIQEHLPSEKPRTIVDLGAGRAHAARMFLYPTALNMPFFTTNDTEKPWRNRVAWSPDQMPDVSRVIAVDNQEVGFDESAQVYMGDANQMDVLHTIEEQEDHDGRLVQIREDVRTLSTDAIREQIGEEEEAPVIFLNNILYAVSDEVRATVEAAVNRLAAELGATILQMESWNLFKSEKPKIQLPDSDKPLGLPAYVRMGTSLDSMRVVATLNGNTGKPFELEKSDGSKVFINKDGEERPITA